MNCPAELASGDKIYIPIFMRIGTGIQIILKFLPKQYEWL
jgi:hypothetical protein